MIFWNWIITTVWYDEIRDMSDPISGIPLRQAVYQTVRRMVTRFDILLVDGANASVH